MRHYRSEITEVVASVTCDMCGRQDSDPFETQEYLAVDFVGGYMSVFGDGDKYTGDFCQRCVKAVLGAYLKPVKERETYT
jgi:hypothetical protein